MHQGIDVSGYVGQPIYAVAPGTVTHATINGAPGFSNYGHTVVVRHDDGRVWTLYAHLREPSVVPGQRVGRGTQLGTMGTSRGRYDRATKTSIPDFFHTSSPHLHFEVRTRSLPAAYGAGALDPAQWLASRGLPLPTTPWGTPVPFGTPPPAVAQARGPKPAIAAAIQAAATRTGVPYSVLAAVAHTESRYDPNAVSPAGAQGLFQLMPRTAAALGVSNPFDPMQSAIAGATFLRQLYAKYGNWTSTLAAYNWGPGNVDRHTPAQWPSRTRTYIAKVLARATPATAAQQPIYAASVPFPVPSSGGGGGAAVAALALGLGLALAASKFGALGRA